MFSRFRRVSKVLIVTGASVLALAACAHHKGGPGGRPKGAKLAPGQERSVELLYSTGAQRLDEHHWADAVQYFHEVEREHPYSEWSRRAILMTAYAHYEANDYDSARDDADRFIGLYPGSSTTVYAYYIKAICYFEQIIDVGRDQAATEAALGALGEVVRRYPNTQYAIDAKLKVDMVNDQLAGKEMAIGRWYLRNNLPLAAIGRFKTVVDRYQTTSHAPEALYRLVEAYLTLGLNEEAQRNAAVLGFNYPGDVWYSDAYGLMKGRGLQPAVLPKARTKHGGIHIPFIHSHNALKPPIT